MNMQNDKDVLYPFTEYNTQRKKLVLPEYGRYIQRMIQQVSEIEDREKRNEQIRAVVSVMGELNPHLRDVNDFKHKLWDHVHIISDFSIDIDSPYPMPTRESFQERPQTIPYPSTPVKIMHYGRGIQNMVEALAERPDNEERQTVAIMIATYMKRDYLMWNKDIVTDEIILRDLTSLSKGRITFPPDTKLADMQVPLMLNGKMNGSMGMGMGRKKKKKKKKKKIYKSGQQ
ncbi:MAG: DUF4290 domain-containing protein [Bacteroidales bacterium]|nr:DUF4290 domain-containing protein [Bacteroidales bacterium]